MNIHSDLNSYVKFNDKDKINNIGFFGLPDSIVETQIHGLYIIPNAFSEQLAKQSIAAADSEEWDSKGISRRVQHYGYEFCYDIQETVPIDKKMPEIFNQVQGIAEEITSVLLYDKNKSDKYFDQLTINEYISKVGIGSHIDVHSVFDDIIGLASFGEPIIMRFRTDIKHSQARCKILESVSKNFRNLIIAWLNSQLEFNAKLIPPEYIDNICETSLFDPEKVIITKNKFKKRNYKIYNNKILKKKRIIKILKILVKNNKPYNFNNKGKTITQERKKPINDKNKYLKHTVKKQIKNDNILQLVEIKTNLRKLYYKSMIRKYCTSLDIELSRYKSQNKKIYKINQFDTKKILSQTMYINDSILNKYSSISKYLIKSIILKYKDLLSPWNTKLESLISNNNEFFYESFYNNVQHFMNPLKNNLDKYRKITNNKLKGNFLSIENHLSRTNFGKLLILPRKYIQHRRLNNNISFNTLSKLSVYLYEPNELHIVLPANSFAILSEDSRYAYSHYIPMRKTDTFHILSPFYITPNFGISSSSALVVTKQRGRRVSFTFRKIRIGECNCNFPEYCDSVNNIRNIPTRMLALREKNLI